MLRHCLCPAAGAKAVAVAIASKAGTLVKLNLRENELEDKGAVIISKALAKVGVGAAT
jgi:hypothetical protein